MLAPTIICRVACLSLFVALCGCSDGATRIAYDIESGVAAFERSGAKRYSIRHVPQASPQGCAGPYAVQFSAHSVLVIWCKRSDGGDAASSHATTYHLRFVKVPQMFKVDKPAGEPLVIELAKEGGNILVTGVR